METHEETTLTWLEVWFSHIYLLPEAIVQCFVVISQLQGSLTSCQH